jgi:hypothetical protein
VPLASSALLSAEVKLDLLHVPVMGRVVRRFFFNYPAHGSGRNPGLFSDGWPSLPTGSDQLFTNVGKLCLHE